MGRWATLIALLMACATLVGCASVPDSSPVQVLRRVGDGDVAVLPPGPVDGSNPLDLVRGFVNASGSSADRHGAARRFLAPEAADWDDTAGLKVIDGLFNTVYADDLPGSGVDVTTVRIRGTAIGTLGADGAFVAGQSAVEVDVGLVRRDDQWRISSLPPGVLVTLTDFQANYRAVLVHVVDPVRRGVVGDLRYLPGVPARAQASRVMDLVLGGPSEALLGAAVSRLPDAARLRANVAESPDGALIVDLTELGELDDESRRLIAAQIVLTLAEVNVGRVRLLADGEPLLADRPDLTRGDVVEAVGEVAPDADVPALVAAGGVVTRISGPDQGEPLSGPAGSGDVDVETAAVAVAGDRLAVVTRTDAGARALSVGDGDGGLVDTGVGAESMTRPTWGPDGTELWTVLDGTAVSRVLLDGGPPRIAEVVADELTELGPIEELRLSRDGMRVAAVVDGRLRVAAVARNLGGEVVLRNVRTLRPGDLGEVVGVAWSAGDALVAIGLRSDRPVSLVAVDGLTAEPLSPSNLTPPLTGVAAAPGRPLLVTDQSGVWSFAGGDLDTWRLVQGGSPDAVPLYPG